MKVNHRLLGRGILSVLLLALLCLTMGCATTTTKGQEFPRMYEEQPLTVLILPPMNVSTAAEAKGYYATTVPESLSYWGYYILPYEITSDILKMEGIYDSELLQDIPLSKFREYFGADAVLFTTINKWDKSYMVISSSLTVSIHAMLKSTHTDQTLWEYDGTVVVDLTGQNAGGGWAGIAASIVMTAAQTAMADYVPYARQANDRALSSLPYGKYHPAHLTDQSMTFVDQTPDETQN